MSLNTVQSMPINYLWYRLSKIFIKIAIVSLLFSLGEESFFDFFIPLSLLFSPYLLYIFLNYKNFSFQVNDENIEIKSGIVSKNSKTIPFHSVQNINLKTGPVQRLFGLASVRIWTSSQSQLQSSNKKIESNPDGALFLNNIDAEQLQEIMTKKNRLN